MRLRRISQSRASAAAPSVPCTVLNISSGGAMLLVLVAVWSSPLLRLRSLEARNAAAVAGRRRKVDLQLPSVESCPDGFCLRDMGALRMG